MSEHEWIVESIVQFFRSPMWNGPVNNFIDENCDIFDHEDEMKVQYTVLHRKFRELLDRLLTDFVTELGIPLEKAMEEIRVCASTMDESKIREPIRRLLSFIFSMDDFRCFHAMMVKRNNELDVMAYAALRAKGLVPDEPRRQSDATANLPDSVSERRAYAFNGEVDEEEAFNMAVQASLQESSMPAKRNELEVAQLNEAIAPNKLTANAEARAPASATTAAGTDVSPSSIRGTDVSAVEPQVARDVQHVMASDSAPTVQASATVAAMAAEAKEHDQQQLATKTLTTQSATLTPIVATQSMAPVEGGTLASAVPVLGGVKALPPIAASGGPAGGVPRTHLSPHDSTNAAKKTTSKPSAAAAPAPVTRETPSRAPMPSKEELERRAAHMRELREKIIEQNKVNRQQEMEAYAQMNNVKLPSQPDERRAAEKQLTIDIARRLRDDIVEEARKA